MNGATGREAAIQPPSAEMYMYLFNDPDAVF